MSESFSNGEDQFEADHSLVERAVAGHEGAQARLVECARGQVFIWSLRLVRDRQRAEDSTQEVLVRMWEHVGDLKDPRAFPSWLYRITLNVCLRRYPADGKSIGSATGALEAVPDTAPGVEELAATRDQLDRLLSELDCGDRQILDMKYRRQLSGREIGGELGISQDAARTRLKEALKRLRTVFQRGSEP